MAKGNFAQRKEKKKPKKAKRNARITTAKALYDNQLIGRNPVSGALNYGY